MNYTLPISWQINIFFLAMGLGFIIGVIYDIIKSIRMLLSESFAAYLISDLSFSVIATLIYFIFTITFCEGEVRFICVLSCISSAVIFHLSIGKLINCVFEKIAIITKKLLSLIFYPLKKTFEFTVNKFIFIFKWFKSKFKKQKNMRLGNKSKKTMNKFNKFRFNFKNTLENF